MCDSENELSRKICFAGKYSTGKTTIIETFGDGSYYSRLPQACVFMTKVGDISVKLVTYDTQTSEKYNAVAPMYYKDCFFAFLVFDITQRESFDELDHWLSELKTHCEPNVKIILIGNKKDAKEIRQVSSDEGYEYAMKHHMKYIEISGKNRSDVIEVYELMANEVVDEFNKERSKDVEENMILNDGKTSYCNLL